MIQWRASAWLAWSLALVLGCASTPCKLKGGGFDLGYRGNMTGEDGSVDFVGNKHTSAKAAANCCLRRAAEMAFEGGYDYIEVVNEWRRGGSKKGTGSVPMSRKDGEYMVYWWEQHEMTIDTKQTNLRFAAHRGPMPSGDQFHEVRAILRRHHGKTYRGVAINAPHPEIPPPRLSASRAAIQQPGTNLWWLRCPLGMDRASGLRCEGNASQLFKAEAEKSCPPGYRLPTIQEVAALLAPCDAGVRKGTSGGACVPCSRSPICRQMFADDKGAYATASTTPSGRHLIAWFEFGNVSTGMRDGRGWIRCVRTGGEEPGPLLRGNDDPTTMESLRRAEQTLADAERDCRAKQPGGCDRVTAARGECDRLAATIRERCRARDAEACNTLGYMYEHGQLIQADRKAAIEAYDSACWAGHGAGCRSYNRLQSSK